MAGEMAAGDGLCLRNMRLSKSYNERFYEDANLSGLIFKQPLSPRSKNQN